MLNNQTYLGVDVINEIKKTELRERIVLLDSFYERCQLFYSILCEQIRRRYDFDNFILSKIDTVSPPDVVSYRIREQYPSLNEILSSIPRFVVADSGQSIDDQWRLLPTYNFNTGDIDLNDDCDKFWRKLRECRYAAGVMIFEKIWHSLF